MHACPNRMDPVTTDVIPEEVTKIGSVFKTLKAKVYHSYIDHLMKNNLRPFFALVEASAAVNARTFGGKLEVSYKPLKKVSVFSGADLLHISRDGERTRFVKMMNGNLLQEPKTFHDKIWQDSYVSDVGVFTETKWNINATTKLTAGLRYDLVFADIRDPEEDFAQLYDLKKRTENNISGTISVKKSVFDNFILEVAY
ncbi:MAG: hypothetical protein ACWA45_05180, partial [Flavobacteriales bacterium]